MKENTVQKLNFDVFIIIFAYKKFPRHNLKIVAFSDIYNYEREIHCKKLLK